MASRSKRRAAKRARLPAPRSQRAPAHARPVVAPRPRAARARRPAVAPAPRRLYGYAVLAAVLAGVLLIGLSELSVHRSTAAAARTGGDGVGGIPATAAMLDGIPQRGNVLGYPQAPLRLVEYADPQCPYCAQFARDVLPTLVRRYVRTGKAQIVFRGLSFLGPDSGTALRTATAAGAQRRMWNVLELLYANQGAENAWVTDGLLRSIVAATGAEAARVLAARDGATVSSALDGWTRLAQADGVAGVPAFFLARRGGTLERLPVTALAPAEFRAALDGALRP